MGLLVSAAAAWNPMPRHFNYPRDVHASQDDSREGVELERQPLDSGIMSKSARAQKGGAAAVDHLRHTSQPGSPTTIKMPDKEHTIIAMDENCLQDYTTTVRNMAEGKSLLPQDELVRLRKDGVLYLSEAMHDLTTLFAAAAPGSSPCFRILDQDFPRVGAATIPSTTSRASEYVLSVQPSAEGMVDNDPGHSTIRVLKTARAFAGVAVAATPTTTVSGASEGVEATGEQRYVVLDVNDADGGSQQYGARASKLQLIFIIALPAAIIGSVTMTIMRFHSSTAAAQVLTWVAIPFEVGTLAVALISMFLRVRVQDTVAPAAPSLYRLTWFVFSGWVLWGVSILVNMAAYRV